MQLSFSRRSTQRLVAQRAVHARQQLGQHRRLERGGHRRQQRAPNAESVRVRQRIQQLRRAPHLQPERALHRPYGDGALGPADASFGGTLHQRAQRAADQGADRRATTSSTSMARGTVYTNPAAGRTAVINTPGGGASRQHPPSGSRARRRTRSSRRRAADSSTPRHSRRRARDLRQPRAQLDPRTELPCRWTRSCRTHRADRRDPQRRIPRWRCSTSSTQANFAGPAGDAAERACRLECLTEAGKVQPGQPYTAAAAGSFGQSTSTVGTTVGLGTNRQIQLAFRLNF